MNNLTRWPQVGQRDGNWMWDGTRWVCDPDCDNGFQPPSPCPPTGPPFTVLQPGAPNPFYPPPVTQPPWYPGANGGVSFAPPGNPPPNPIRGAFWWDGTSLWLFDGAAWDVVGAGSGTVITPPGTTFPKNPAPGEQFFDGTQLWIWDGNAWIPLSQTKTYVQATAPPSPNSGDLWFDGTQLHIWTGSAWDLVGPGATVGPVPTSTLVLGVAAPVAITVPTAYVSQAVLSFTANPTIDTLSGFDTVSKKYTPNKPGLYLFNVIGPLTNGGGVSLLKNDGGTFTNSSADIIICVATESTGGTVSSTNAVHMNGTTDYVRMYAWAVGGSFPGNGANSVLNGVLLP